LLDLGYQFNQAICYFVGIQGGFNNSEVELLALQQYGPNYALNGTLETGLYWEWYALAAQGSGTQVAASVECMPFVQNR
jgi:hypothetical protein